jgi:hypothetical protein
VRKTLQKHERSNTTLEKRASCKQEQDHNAKPTTKRHNQEQKNTKRQKENYEMK